MLRSQDDGLSSISRNSPMAAYAPNATTAVAQVTGSVSRRSGKGRATARCGTTAGGAVLTDSAPDGAGCSSPIARRIPRAEAAGNGSDEQEFPDPPAGRVQTHHAQRGQVPGPPQQAGADHADGEVTQQHD